MAKGKATELTVEYTIVYISPVNRFIKSCIERGADGGLNKNFGQVLGALKQQVAVEDASIARAAAIADFAKVGHSANNFLLSSIILPSIFV